MINLVEKIKNIKILNQLDLDNKKIMLIALVSAIVFYIDINFIFMAQLKGFNKAQTEITRIKKDINNFKAESKKIKELESKQVSPKAGLKEKRIITEAQFASLLQDISKIANNNEVKILQLKPFRQSLPANQDAKVKALGSFTPFLILLDLSSGYHNLGKFINGLENLESFVKVQEIKIEPFEDTYLNQKVNLVLVTYVKK